MKFFCAVLAISLFLVGSARCFSQGFVNLDFESAQIVPSAGSYPNGIATTNALPGWEVFFGSSQQSQITYNNPTLGETFITLYATNGEQLAGDYSVLLQGGSTASAATITQTGLVPVLAQSLLFYGAGNSSLSSGLVVSLGGQDLPFFAISTGPDYTIYGANISSFAGQTETLSFSALEAIGGYNNWNIDDIQFSTSPIPEPGTLELCVLGGSSLAWRWRKKIVGMTSSNYKGVLEF